MKSMPEQKMSFNQKKMFKKANETQLAVQRRYLEQCKQD
jgi:hypothetical protein